MKFLLTKKTKPVQEFGSELIKSLKHKTPYFVFSKDRILKNFNEYKELFPNAFIKYAMKANFEEPILKILKKIGAGFEVASIYELDFLKKIKVPADNIIFGTAVKAASDIKYFYDYGVRIFACDSTSEIEKIASMAPKSKIYVRLKVSNAGAAFDLSEKFGTSKENVLPLLRYARELGLQPYGISFHVGSQATNHEAWSQSLELVKEIVTEAEQNSIHIEVINIGGGFPCTTYTSFEENFDLADIAESIHETCRVLGLKQKLLIEPGRGIIANTGILVATIIGRVERAEGTWLFLDAGVYQGLFESMAYQGSTRYKITSVRESFNSSKMMFALAGPTGDSPDVISREVLLPKDISIGDKLIIHDVGAYSLPTCSPFHGFPKPCVYLI